jgi:predicted nucleic-acid-binding Zn-ribbon protein
MSDSVHCPKCNSTQVSAQKRGFSGGKAIAGAVVVGGVGALAGFHNSGNIEIHCLKCGNTWSPVVRATEQRQAQVLDEKRWKANFYREFGDGNMYKAEEIIFEQRPYMLRASTLPEVYKELKKEDRNFNIVMLIGTGLLVGLVGWVASCMG